MKVILLLAAVLMYAVFCLATPRAVLTRAEVYFLPPAVVGLAFLAWGLKLL